ncbi:MAG: 6-bladed beta-propeller [Actinobacteria bacterium]|nr:6-bladed beta-propeller [Actinomycetota bacterium]
MLSSSNRHVLRILPFPAMALLAALIIISCTAKTPPQSSQPQILALWPNPPTPARIALLRTLTDSAEIERPGFFQRLGQIIVGPKKHTILRPQGIAIQDDHRLYVTDLELQGVHVFDLNSHKSSFIDRIEDTFFVSPVGVAVCDKLIAVSDSALKKVFLLKPNGQLERTLQKPGGFERPTGLAFDAQEKLLYVVDTLANEICVFDLSGRLLRRFGSAGQDIGQFNYPTYIFVDKDGRVYVTDSLNFRVQVFNRQGQYLFDIGKLGDASGYFAVPKGIGVDSFGHIYIVDSYFSVVQVYDQQGQFLLDFGGPGKNAGSFQVPAGLTIDSQNRIFICDSYNSRIQIFQYIGSDNE